MNNKNSQLTLPTVRLVLGIFAIVLSLVFSIQFVAQGNTGGAILTAIIFCLITEFAKVAFCSDFAFYFETNQGSKALFAGIIVALLFCLSISAAVFVLTISPAKEDTLISQADDRTSSIQKSIDSKKAQLALCNPSHMSKCINPRTKELNDLESQMTALLAQNSALTEAKANKQFWTKAADYLGTNANSLQLNFAIARAVLLDLLGLIFISQYTAAKRLQNLGTQDLQSNPNALHGQALPDNSAAEVFALMSAKIEQLERKLEEKKL